MKKREFKNKLNDLDPKSWIKFQKSWFIHNPPPRSKELLTHPAKFPETLAQEFIEFFTKRGGVVLDPMAGTGSTIIAAAQSGRFGFGIELNPKYAQIAQSQIEGYKNAKIILGDAHHLPEIIEKENIPPIDYVLTSPPYWDMLHAKGATTQRQRRTNPELDVTYSALPQDLGNIHDYDLFLDKLCAIYQSLKPYLKQNAYLTIIVKNVKKKGKLYPLAWDLASRLSHTYQLKDEKIWCQDNQRLFPYGMGNAWVSNTFHHYCLQFRNES